MSYSGHVLKHKKAPKIDSWGRDGALLERDLQNTHLRQKDNESQQGFINLYSLVQQGFKAEYFSGFDVNSEKMFEYKDRFERCDHDPFHKILDALESQVYAKGTGDMGRADLLESLKRWHYAGIAALESIVSFWKNSELVENLQFSGRGVGNEVVIQGPVYYVEVEPWKQGK